MKKVRVIYDPALRRPAIPVTIFDEDLNKTAALMFEAMHRHHGMGLAANQIGLAADLLVIEFKPEHETEGKTKLKPIPPLALCNARIVKTSGARETENEGCLSLPGLELPVHRPSGVTVEAQTLTGKKITIKAKGLLARILQHEIDHLDGRLFTDSAQGVKDLKNYAWAKIVFLGSDEFSVTVLRELLDSGINVMAAVTESAKPAGRGGSLTATAVGKFAQETGLAVLTPQTKTELTDVLRQLKANLGVLASYGKILPAAALEATVYGILNVHPSLLPQYRGATPIQTAILDGASITGVTVMKLNEGIDTGVIVAQKAAGVDETDSYITLRDRLARLGANLLISQLPTYLAGQAKLADQDENQASGTKKLTKEMGEIDWDEPAELIARQVRALNPWPGTYTKLKDKRFKIKEAEVVEGKLKLTTVQLEGKRPTPWADFVRGHSVELKKTPWYGKIA